MLATAPLRRRKVGAPLRESIRSSRASLRGNPLRTALTMLGIIIGVGAVVALLAIGNGVKAEARANLERNGTNLITVQPELNAASGNANNTLTLEDAQALRNTGSAPSIETVSASVLTVTQITVGATSTFGEVRGVEPSYAGVHSYAVSQGSFINEAQESSHQQVIVLGAQTATKLFSGGGAVGKSVRVNGKSFKVIGVMEEKGGSGFGSLDTGTYVPLSTALAQLVGGRQRSVGSGKTVNLIEVKAKSAERVNTAIEEITRTLTARHKLGVGGKPDFQVRNQADQIKSALATQNLLTIFLVVIASISLLVGGIGIMNIMLVSVTERTREIGIRKAVGARSRDILTQFLVESVLISVLGAAAGVFAGIAASLIVTAVWKRALVSPGSIVAAIVVAMAIGLFFGVYPARRASLLRPIEALRYE
jgi:putative ABC transport system permease protein